MEKQLISSHHGTVNLQLGNDSMIAMKLTSSSTKLSKELANQLAMFILLNSATLINLETSTPHRPIFVPEFIDCSPLLLPHLNLGTRFL